MYLLFSWFCFLQTALLFSVLAQEGGEDEQAKPVEPETKPDTPPIKQESGESNKNDLKDRFISHNEKPAIFGSHAYNPITQEFEALGSFNESIAHNMSAFHHHTHHEITETTEVAPPAEEPPQQEIPQEVLPQEGLQPEGEGEAEGEGSTNGPGRHGRFKGFKKINQLQASKLKLPWSGFRVTENITKPVNATSNTQMKFLTLNNTINKIF